VLVLRKDEPNFAEDLCALADARTTNPAADLQLFRTLISLTFPLTRIRRHRASGESSTARENVVVSSSNWASERVGMSSGDYVAGVATLAIGALWTRHAMNR